MAPFVGHAGFDHEPFPQVAPVANCLLVLLRALQEVLVNVVYHASLPPFVMESAVPSYGTIRPSKMLMSTRTPPLSAGFGNDCCSGGGAVKLLAASRGTWPRTCAK